MTDLSPKHQNGERYIVGLRFQRVGKIYHFDASNVRDLKPGDFAVVETSRGSQLGQMIFVVNSPDPSVNGGLKPVLRRATAQDLILRQTWEQKEAEAMASCQEKAKELGFMDVKIISAEFSFDGSRLYFLYSCEEGEKTDLKSLRRAMQRLYSQNHIELHLIGPRDVAKILGGMGACGLEIRCCSAFLPDFSPISIKMAKEQGISLTPTEITGMCGRLRCCLVYEYEQYAEARKQLPKRGKRVSTPMGEGKVVDVLALKSSVVIELDSGGQHEFTDTEITNLDEQEQIKKNTEALSDHLPDKGKQGAKKGRLKGNEQR
jgi:cell fate regulator YaaT (PSP1 superfamily)